MVANNLEDTPRGFTRETFDANVSNQLLADYYYPAFRASIVAADAKGVMCALNAVRGKPACLSPLLKAARAGKPAPPALNMRLFYAHLYLGLYYEAAGKEELARKHLYKAADDHRIGHYMWDVAHVHANILRSKEKEKK